MNTVVAVVNVIEQTGRNFTDAKVDEGLFFADGTEYESEIVPDCAVEFVFYAVLRADSIDDYRFNYF
jgi:hypothetical protein